MFFVGYNIASLVVVDVFYHLAMSSRRLSGGRISVTSYYDPSTSKAFLEELKLLQWGRHHSTNHPLQTAKRIEKHHWRARKKTFHKTSTSTSKAMLSPPLEDRPLVEEREEFFALSREEEKAV